MVDSSRVEGASFVEIVFSKSCSGIKVPISKESGNQGLLLKNCMKIKELGLRAFKKSGILNKSGNL